MCKRFLCILLVSLVFVSALGTAGGAETSVRTLPGYVRQDGVNVYQYWTTSSAVLATCSANDVLQISAVRGGWCQVVNGPAVGYVPLADLSASPVSESAQAPEAVVPARTVTGYANRDGVNVYQYWTTASSVLTTLNKNATVQISGVRNGWCQLYSDGVYGYVPLSDLSDKQIVEQQTRTVYVKNSGAKVYRSFSTDASVLCTLEINTQLTLHASNNGWAQVSSGTAVGYMLVSDLSDAPVQVPQTVTGYVKNEGAKVYSTFSTSASVLCTLGINTAVSVSGEANGWCQVVNGTIVGYMLTSDLSATKVETASASLQPGDTGDAVKALQSRLKDLGYFVGTIGGNYQSLTQAAVAAFQAAAGLTVTGTADAVTLVKLASEDAPKNSSNSGGSSGSSSGAGYSTATPATGTAIEMNWWDSGIQKIFARGTVATVTDVQTGVAWYEKRTGGTNHADVQPLTAADTNSMKQACGSWSWTRRPIFVTINGVNYAASMNCMPHGSGSITNNNFDGHHCIHFTKSRTHGSNSVCSLHQAAIRKALAASL